jgi:hypothetical protein
VGSDVRWVEGDVSGVEGTWGSVGFRLRIVHFIVFFIFNIFYYFVLFVFVF